ncbi:MAG TPA: hypothetical protein VLL57_07850, partial [Candidatus Binataceae bacterium]|nr:hypothetical protein [Candidatus Binataceae bacterium]
MNLETEGRGFKGFLFTENETNATRLWGVPNGSPYVKDAFHDYVIEGRTEVVNPEGVGTKAAAHHFAEIPAGKSVTVKLRLFSDAERPREVFGASFDATF